MNLAEYRDVTYEMDPDFHMTTSWSDGLNEEQKFVPHLPLVIRRTNSTDDIGRYKRYFKLAQSNQGKLFTWRYYLKVLKDDLRHFDTAIIMTKMLLKRVATPANSEVSNYMTASDSDSSKKKTPGSKKSRRIFFKRKTCLADAESISSMDDISISSNMSLTPHTNLLKRMCTEIRTLAHKTCKTVEKISTKSKFCIACGDYIGNVKIHKDCSQPFVEGTKCSKPLTSTMSPTSTVVRSKESVMELPEGGDEVQLDKFNKMNLASSCACRMKHFISQSPKKIAG